MLNIEELLARTASICRRAGEAIEAARKTGCHTDFKNARGHDPVTTADHAADALLRHKLTALLPGSSYFSEESRRAGGDDACWIVDPMDGTKEFVRGIPEYAVSVLLQHQGEDVLAVVHNPASGETIYGSSQGVFLNGGRVAVTTTATLTHAKALASRTEAEAGEWDRFADLQLAATGSVAWKCALVAAGRADLTFSLRPRHVWDVGAGFALVRWAGGRVSDKEGQCITIAPTYTKVRCFLATNGHVHTALLARLFAVPLGPDRRN